MGRESGVRASIEWLSDSGNQFSAPIGRTGAAHLQHYTARFCEWGEGPPLVLVPGMAGGYELLGQLAGLLAREFRVISYQLRGEDDCFALRQRFGLHDLVDDLREFMDWHNLESPAVLGVSFGGVVALELATTCPRRLQALALQGVGVRFEPGLLQQVAGLVLSRYPLPADSPFVNQFFNLLFGSRQRPGPLFEFVTRQCWQTDQSIMSHRFQLVEAFDAEPRLSAVRVPTLALAGDRDLIVSPRSLAGLAAGIADCQTVTLRGCGHFASVTRAEAVAAEVVQFLRAQAS